MNVNSLKVITKDFRLVSLNVQTGSCERQPALWIAFLGLAEFLGICRLVIPYMRDVLHWLPYPQHTVYLVSALHTAYSTRACFNVQ